MQQTPFYSPILENFVLEEKTDLFALHVTSLINAIGYHKKVLCVYDSSTAVYLPDLKAYLWAQKRQGALENFCFVCLSDNANENVVKEGIALVEAGIGFGLSRTDCFMVMGKPFTTDLAAWVAGMYRRSCKCVRLVVTAETRAHLLKNRRSGSLTFTDSLSGLSIEFGSAEREVISLSAFSQDVGPARGNDSLRSYEKINFLVEFSGRLFEPGNRDLDKYLSPKKRFLVIADAYNGNRGRLLEAWFRERCDKGQLEGYELFLSSADPEEKDFRAVMKVVRRLAAMNLGKEDLVMAVGGGTLMDIVGFAAQLFKGGIPYLRIPTTMVGIIDAGVGMKVGVNFRNRKNFIGAYYAPVATVCDPTFLETLPVEEIRCGLAEAIKMGVIKSRLLFDLIDTHFTDITDGRSTPEAAAIFRYAIDTMVEELEMNPFEKQLDRIVDFGHEFGHVIESLAEYHIRHGEAVSIGMVLSCYIAFEKGILRRYDFQMLVHLLLKTGLPVYSPECRPDALWDHVFTSILPHKADKLYLVVPTRIGHATFINDASDITETMLKRACEFALQVQQAWVFSRKQRATGEFNLEAILDVVEKNPVFLLQESS